jgi:DNA-binding cell septation regulator SpoVG
MGRRERATGIATFPDFFDDTTSLPQEGRDDSMQITEITVRLDLERPNPQIRGYANIVFDDCFAVSSIRIIRRDNGRLIVCMPSRRLDGPDYREGGVTYHADGQPYHYRDDAHPITRQFRDYVDRMILETYCDLERSGEFEMTVDFGAEMAPAVVGLARAI